ERHDLRAARLSAGGLRLADRLRRVGSFVARLRPVPRRLGIRGVVQSEQLGGRYRQGTALLASEARGGAVQELVDDRARPRAPALLLPLADGTQEREG